MTNNKLFGVGMALATLLLTSIAFNIQSSKLIARQRATICTLQKNSYKLEECKEALRLSDIIMDNNALWDRDGSDVMSEYLNLRANMDTTFYQGFHKNALLDSLSYDYNE